MSIEAFERGNNVRIKAVPEDVDGNPTQPDVTNNTAKIYIEITDINDGTQMVGKTTMDDISNTEYKYDWQTTEGMQKGEYAVEVKASMSQNTVLDRDRIRLDEIIGQ